MDNKNIELLFAELVVSFCLSTSGIDSLRTVYHDRIDGLLLPVMDMPMRRGPWEQQP